MMQFLPFDMQGVKPGGFNRPEGWYLLKVNEVEIVQAEGAPNSATKYITETVMGPNTSQDFAGKKWTDRIPNTDAWKPAHMELLVACMGSEQAVHDTARQQLDAAGRPQYAPAMVIGRLYMAYIKANKGGFDNAQRRVPYTEENWNSEVVNQAAMAGPGAVPAAAGILTQAVVTPPVAAPPPVAAAPVAAPVYTQPVAAPVAPPAPVAYAQPAPAPAPLPVAAPPAYATPPAQAAPPPPAAMPPAYAPPAPPAAPPAPPPPPGMPATPGQ